MEEFNGLTWKEATKALRVHGHNEFTPKNVSLLNLYLKQYYSSTSILLFTGILISIFQGNGVTLLLLLLILLISTYLGFYREYQLKNITRNIHKSVRNQVNVLRDGKKVKVNIETIVPGDIIFLQKGDIVSADGFILQLSELNVDTPSVINTSSKASKVVNIEENKGYVNGNLYRGTKILSGECTLKVFATGDKTKIAKTNTPVYSNSEKSNIEYKIYFFSKKYLLVAIIAALCAILFLNIFVNRLDSTLSVIQFLIAVAALVNPLNISSIVAFIFASSADKLLQKDIIIRNNTSIEDLAKVEVVCADKNGTITLDKIEVDFYHSVIDEAEFFKYSYLSTVENSNKIDNCIFQFLKTMGVEDQSEFMLEEIPFDSSNTYSVRKFKDFEIIKGTPEYIFKISKYKSGQEEELIKFNKDKGLKIISLAITEGKKTKYIGSYFFFDQIRDNSAQVIKQSREMGLVVKIISEDTKEIAQYVAQKIGLIHSEAEAIDCKELNYKNKKLLSEQIKKHSVFSNCTNEDRIKIIECLRKKQNVAYIGNGIDDYECLNSAQTSIVNTQSNDISKEMSDVVIGSQNFENVIAAIETSRDGIQNIQKYLQLSMVQKIGILLSTFVLILISGYMPATADHFYVFLLISLVLTAWHLHSNISFETLEKVQLSIKKISIFSFIFGTVLGIFLIILFEVHTSTIIELVRTQWFMLLSIIVVLTVLVLSSNKSILQNPTQISTFVKFGFISLLVVFFAIAINLFGEFTLNTDLFFIVVTSVLYLAFIEFIKIPILRILKTN